MCYKLVRKIFNLFLKLKGCKVWFDVYKKKCWGGVDNCFDSFLFIFFILMVKLVIFSWKKDRGKLIWELNGYKILNLFEFW